MRGTGQGVQGRTQSRGLHQTVGPCPKDESKRGPRDRPCLALNLAPQSPDPSPLQTSHRPHQPFWLPCRTSRHELEPPERPAQAPSQGQGSSFPISCCPPGLRRQGRAHPALQSRLQLVWPEAAPRGINYTPLFILAHNPSQPSSLFLLENNGNYALNNRFLQLTFNF